MQRILVADVETTGIGVTDEIVELSFIEVDESLNQVFSFDQRFKPTCAIQPAASAAHGLVAADLADKPAIADTLGNSDSFNDVFLIAHNAQFDQRFLSKYWSIQGVLCTLRVAKRLYPDLEAHSLQVLRYALELDVGKDAVAHSAMGDVLVLLALLKRLVADFGKPLPQLVDYFSEPIMLTKMPFGKHRGELITNLPFGYRRWLLGLDDLDTDLKYTLEHS